MKGIQNGLTRLIAPSWLQDKKSAGGGIHVLDSRPDEAGTGDAMTSPLKPMCRLDNLLCRVDVAP
jgi:hypothetical protein